MKSLEKIINVLRNGFYTQREIKSLTNLAQSTISRSLTTLKDSLIILKGSNPTQYTLPYSDNADFIKYSFYQMDTHGKITSGGEIYPLKGSRFYVDVEHGGSSLYLGHNKNGLYDDLPFFLDDLKPQGFLGNQIAKQLFKNNPDYPKKLSFWKSHHIINYLIEYGTDLPGNIIFTDGVSKNISRPVLPIGEDSYNHLCEQVETGMVPQSSAAGEQQKFTAFNKKINAHVLVKFTSNKDDDVTRRWKDILVTEFHALNVLRKYRVPSAGVRLIDRDNRFYLETKRFDRIGNHGRSSMFSLQSIDNEYSGLGDNWLEIYKELKKDDLVLADDEYYVTFLWVFSQWICNTDTHLGNISFAIDGDKFSLLPIYDMCSMTIAPSINSVKPINFNLPPVEHLQLSGLKLANIDHAVITFWKQVSKDKRISDEFRQHIAENPTIQNLLQT